MRGTQIYPVRPIRSRLSILPSFPPCFPPSFCPSVYRLLSPALQAKAAFKHERAASRRAAERAAVEHAEALEQLREEEVQVWERSTVQSASSTNQNAPFPRPGVQSVPSTNQIARSSRPGVQATL